MNKKILLAALAIALVFGMTLAGCASTGGSRDPKSIKITGIPSDVYETFINDGGVFGSLTRVGKENTSRNVVALYGIRGIDIGDTLFAGLRKTDNSLWTEKGKFDVWLNSASTIYKAGSVVFDKAETTLDFSDFTLQ
jgi:hypothetical protein